MNKFHYLIILSQKMRAVNIFSSTRHFYIQFLTSFDENMYKLHK